MLQDFYLRIYLFIAAGKAVVQWRLVYRFPALDPFLLFFILLNSTKSMLLNKYKTSLSCKIFLPVCPYLYPFFYFFIYFCARYFISQQDPIDVSVFSTAKQTKSAWFCQWQNALQMWGWMSAAGVDGKRNFKTSLIPEVNLSCSLSVKLKRGDTEFIC